VTERAYNNPMFVEDIARAVYNSLDKMEDIEKFKISVESDESIHAHNAVAIMTNY
jgi:GTP cyclohydrolase I